MRFINASFSFAVMAAFAMLMLLTPAYAKTAGWQISESSGQVSVQSVDTSRAAVRGIALQPGDVIQTGQNGRAVIVRGREYVVLSPRSRIRITNPKETGAIAQIYQYIGSALFRIQKKETPHFGVNTPYLAAVVKGTTFNVTVTYVGATVQVTEGRVQVSTLDGGASDLIVPGRIARIDATDRKLLTVLGKDEKAIRSPLPAGSADTPIGDGAALDQTISGDETAVKSESQDDNVAETDADLTATEIGEPGTKGDDGFSAQLDSAVRNEPVNIAAITGGLVIGGRNIDKATTGPVNSPGQQPSTGKSPDKGDPTSGADKGDPKDGADKDDPKDGSDKGGPKDGSDKGDPKDGSDKGDPKDGSDKGDPKDGSDKGGSKGDRDDKDDKDGKDGKDGKGGKGGSKGDRDDDDDDKGGSKGGRGDDDDDDDDKGGSKGGRGDDDDDDDDKGGSKGGRGDDDDDDDDKGGSKGGRDDDDDDDRGGSKGGRDGKGGSKGDHGDKEGSKDGRGDKGDSKGGRKLPRH